MHEPDPVAERASPSLLKESFQEALAALTLRQRERLVQQGELIPSDLGPAQREPLRFAAACVYAHMAILHPKVLRLEGLVIRYRRPDVATGTTAGATLHAPLLNDQPQRWVEVDLPWAAQRGGR